VKIVSTEQVLNKAYRLAYFLHQDKGLAIRIVSAATLKLNVAMAVQSKRLYYVPVGRFSRGESRRTDGIRNKALFSDLHLLQRLLYVESEPYERQKERAAAQIAPPDVHAAGDPASEEDLLVYFIKHLVRITTKRNAFYVTLGVSRLLHSYSTFETMEIYNAVIGEPERVKDDYYYRSRKAVLMHEMYLRFGQLIRACRQHRGEERFETQQGSSELRSLVREALRLFTPWDTQCPVPHDFDPLKSVIAKLTSKSSADENEVEVNRIHAILHPDCFSSLVAALGYSSPAERMELPHFFSEQSDDQSPPRQRSAPTELSAEELAEINTMLAEQAARRRRSSPTDVIRIMVDGVERGRLNPVEQSSISFSVDEDAEVIEVMTASDLLLATHLLTSFEKHSDDATIFSSIRLEGGQDLSLSITKRQINPHGGADFMVTFSYRETAPRRAVRLWWQRLNLRAAPEPGLQGIPGWARISAQHILAGSVLVICLAGYLGYVSLRSPQTSEPAQIVGVQSPATGLGAEPGIGSGQDGSVAANPSGEEVSPPTRETPKPANNKNTQPEKSNRSATAKTPAPDSADVVAQSRNEDVGDAMRSGTVVSNLTLREVKKIYIEIRGGEALDELRGNLVESLNSSGVVTVTGDAEEADAALKIVISQNSTSARLVNARGVVLWPRNRGLRRYSGETSKVVSEVVRDLLLEIKQAK
jgi:hypothetical protein